VTPQRRHARPAAAAGAGNAAPRWSWPGVCGIIAAGAALGAAAAAALGAEALPAAGIGACILGYGYVLYCCYAWPSSVPEEPRNVQTESSHE
jgi:predicted lipid-binding transport protein (Tim44 family)